MVEIEKKEAKETKEVKEPKDIKEQAKPQKTTGSAKPRLPQETLLHIKPARLITLLLQEKQWNTAALARESGQSYVYATELIKVFEQGGLVSVTTAGKRRVIKLTEKGEKTARLVFELLQLPTDEQQKVQKPVQPQ